MIDFQCVADAMQAATSVMSVEVKEDGTLGTLRIVTGNKAYIDSIERPAGDYQMFHNKFIPNSVYTDYVPRDLNFEDYCFRSAVGQKCLHSYVKPAQMPVWFNMTFMPIGPSQGNIHFCTYTMEVNFEANAQRMTNISADLASAVLETCIKLRGTVDFHATIQEVISDIRELCKAEHCCILLMDSYEKSCKLLCEDILADAGIKSIKDSMDKDFYDMAHSWMDVIGSSNCVIAKNENDMELVKERNPVWFQSLMANHVKNIVLFPLKFKDELLGYIWASNFDGNLAPKIKDTLELTTFILGSEIANHLLVDRLKVLSSKDMLTGVLNRNEMNNLVDKMCLGQDGEDDKSVGVIFCDLNGLKTVNDEHGHGVGDNLLKDAAKALNKVFDADCIFRAGGDEFTVIISGITRDELDQKIACLRKLADEYPHLSFAIGRHVETDKKNVRTALRLADQDMYADKRRFYEEHPERTRRLQ